MPDRNVILNAVVGSTAYGMATPTSDKDELGIYVAPLPEVLGLSGRSAVDNSDHQANRADGGPDYTLHEVGKYCRLALKCNPSILELLYLDEYLTKTALGTLLIKHRNDFLNTPSIVGAYGAYAKQQADRLMRRNSEGKEGFSSDVGKRTAKHARHCMRLIYQGSQLLSTGSMQVRVDQDTRSALFLAGEVAENDPARFYVHHYEPAQEAFEAAAANSVLPEHPNRDVINQMLVQIRQISDLRVRKG